MVSAFFLVWLQAFKSQAASLLFQFRRVQIRLDVIDADQRYAE